MNTIGLDFGTSALKAVSFQSAVINGVNFALPLIVASNFGTEGQIQLLSLKRRLESDDESRRGDSPADAAEALVRALKKAVQAISPSEVESVGWIISAPAVYSLRRKSALLDAANRAGMWRAKLLADAGAVLLGAPELIADESRILLYDWGASHFTAGLFILGEDGCKQIAQEGTLDLGGLDLEFEVFSYLMSQFLGQSCRFEPAPDLNLKYLIDLTREAHKALAEGRDFIVSLHALQDEIAPAHWPNESITLTQGFYQPKLQSSIQNTLAYVDETLAGAGWTKPDLIIMAGGMSRIESVRQAVAQHLPAKVQLAPLDAVVKGCQQYGLSCSPADWEEAEIQAARRQARLEANSAPPPPPASPKSGQRDDKLQLTRWTDEFSPLLDSAQDHFLSGDFQGAATVLNNVLSRIEQIRDSISPNLSGTSAVRGGVGREAVDSGKKSSATKPPGRNAPCPCRSGKKYKNCCEKKYKG